MRILLDNNAIDKINEHLDYIKSHKDIEFYICKEVAHETSENRSISFEKNFISLLKVGVKYIPNSVFAIGHTILDGESYIGSYEASNVYYNILNKNKSNIADAIIAATAYENDCIVLTYDKKFYKKMKKYNYQVVTFEELKGQFLSNQL